MRATAAAGLAARGRRTVKFPCGHTGSERHLARRLRERPNALWVRCPRCNVIAVVVAGQTR